jgi:oxygen-independent coproporphyrinogen-3 oxidase
MREATWGTGFGIYVHVPFCVRRCQYCSFVSRTFDPGVARAYVRGVRRETARRAAEPALAGRVARSLFVGGGTPTCLPVRRLCGLLRALRTAFNVVPSAEVTVEANPGTVNAASLAALRRAGASRLSLGVQAFQDRLLQDLGRLHRAADGAAAVAAARQAGFENISLDLMFGLPGQTPGDWRETLERAIALEPQHVSAYALAVDPGTPFGEMAARGALDLPTEDVEAEMYEAAISTLGDAGFEHYEVSNFGRPGFFCRHNLLYWRDGEYLGLGAGAHSHFHRPGSHPGLGRRYWNHPDPLAYCQALRRGEFPIAGAEDLDPRVEMGDAVMMGLRLIEGIPRAAFRRRFGVDLVTAFPGAVARLGEQGLLSTSDGHVRLTPRGLRLGNVAFAAFAGGDES